MTYQISQPKFDPYCLMCGSPTKEETCSFNCKDKLSKLRNAISSRIETEQSGEKQYTERTIRDFNKIQDIIG